MFRKILIATVASLSLLSPLALPSESQAREVHRSHGRAHVAHRRGYAVHGHRYAFRVYYRGCKRDAWRFSAGYGCRADAVRAADGLRGRGFEVNVR